jgi:hypothetical protein
MMTADSQGMTTIAMMIPKGLRWAHPPSRDAMDVAWCIYQRTITRKQCRLELLLV